MSEEWTPLPVFKGCIIALLILLLCIVVGVVLMGALWLYITALV